MREKGKEEWEKCPMLTGRVRNTWQVCRGVLELKSPDSEVPPSHRDESGHVSLQAPVMAGSREAWLSSCRSKVHSHGLTSQ